MKHTLPILVALLLGPFATLDAAGTDLSKVVSRGDLDAVIAETNDALLRQSLTDHAAAILAAAEQHPHVLAVIRTIESAPGGYRKVNTTPAALKQAAGGEIAIFDTLTVVNTGIAGGKAHVHRNAKDDPYDADFIEHLGHVQALESVSIVAENIEDSWLPPLLKLKNLKSFSLEGKPGLGDPSLARFKAFEQLPGLRSLQLRSFGKATDAGLEQLAGLRQLESLDVAGLPIKGHGFAKFEGWTGLKSINFHGNSLDDEGFGHVCERFPNLEFIKLWHSKFLTDASAEHLGKLKKLTGIEISGNKATAGLVKPLRDLPLKFVSLDYGVNAPAADAIETAKAIPTLQRFRLSGALTDADLTALADATQLVFLEVQVGDLSDERLPLFQAFSFLKSLVIKSVKTPFSPETQTKVKALLPKVEVTFP